MADKITLCKPDIKDFVFCDICAADGYLYEKVVFKYTGFRSEDEDGFAYKYAVSEFENPDRIHIHRSLRGLQHHASPDHDSHLKEHFACEFWEDHYDHSDAITFIDMLPELFPRFFKKKSFNKLQEFVN
ncbi:MAG TPA: hypothetical protein VJ729_07265 [Nitrososphaeraceae archaeon]|nr:hypothetical protein [Nitrososphaeraceae archaeon]